MQNDGLSGGFTGNEGSFGGDANPYDYNPRTSSYGNPVDPSLYGRTPSTDLDIGNWNPGGTFGTASPGSTSTGSGLSDLFGTPFGGTSAPGGTAGGGTTRTTGGGSTGSSTTTRTPTQPMPTLGTTAPYTNPAWSQDQIKAYAQEDSALGISEARDALMQGVNKVVSMQGNPTAQAQAMRELLKGHSSAIAKTMQGANKEALSRYQQQYAYQVQEAMSNFNAAQHAVYAKYQADMARYMGTFTTTTQPGSGGSRGGVTSVGWAKSGESWGTPMQSSDFA